MIPKEYIACAACETHPEYNFQWTIPDITNYKMVIISAARYNRLSFLQQLEEEVLSIVEVRDIYKWISKLK